MRDDLIERLREYGEPVSDLSIPAVFLHPLADEADVLRRLELKAADCTHCDAYFIVDDNLVFASVDAQGRESAVRFFKKRNTEHPYTFRAVLSEDLLTTDTMKDLIRRFSEWLRHNADRVVASHPEDPMDVGEVS